MLRVELSRRRWLNGSRSVVLEKSALFLDHSSPRANPDVFVLSYLDAGLRRHDELFFGCRRGMLTIRG